MSIVVAEDVPGVVRFRTRAEDGRISYPLLDELDTALDAIARRADVRAVVLEGGADDFAAGSDLDPTQLPERWRRRAPSGSHGYPPVLEQAIVRRVWNLEVPVVAVLHGTVTDFGFVVACAADFRVAEASAVLSLGTGDPHGASGAAWLLPRLLGLSRANRFLLLGDAVDAVDAASIGLVHKIVTPSARDEFVATVAALPTRSFAAHKRQVHDQLELGLEHALWHSLAVRQTYVIEDVHEGRAAFTERRAPRFTGR